MSRQSARELSVVVGDRAGEGLRRALKDALRVVHAPDAAVVLTNNRVRLVSVRRTRLGNLEVRVARRLLALGPDVVPLIAAFALREDGAAAALRGVLAALPPAPVARRRRPSLRPAGEHHDLRPLAAREGARLGLQEVLPVTWGSRRRRPGRRQRTMRLGSYVPSGPYVRVHTALDHPLVPGWYLGFVLFHELLHHKLGRAARGARGQAAGHWHHEAFRDEERRHPRFQDAQRWEQTNIPRLLAGLPPAPWDG